VTERLPLLAEPNAVAQAARDYLSAGWQPIPVRPRSKKPVRDAWQLERWTERDLPEQFSADKNIGLLLGAPSNGLVDLDLDCSAAVALGSLMLPATGFKSGRPSKPFSHFWYSGNPVPEHRKFEDVDGTCLLELRTVGQTVVPPSLYEGNGEQLVWHESEGTPATIAGSELSRVAEEMAAAALTVRHYPRAGSRHEFALSFSGFLLNQGWDVDRVRQFVEVTAKAASDEEWQDRVKCVQTSAERLQAGEKTLGGMRLREIWGEVLDRFCDFLQFVKTARFAAITVEADCVAPDEIPAWPLASLDGDYIMELAYQLTKGTAIPPQFVRETVNVVLGAAIEGKVGFPQHPHLSTRRYVTLISERAQQCKGESWNRVAGNTPEGGALCRLLEAAGVKVLTGSGIGSGQYLAKELQSNPRSIVHWDETTGFFAQTGMQNSTLLSILKNLFEGTSAWTGSLTNKKHGTDDAHLSILLHATRASFTDGFKLRGGMGDGLLSRFTLVYAAQTPAVPLWQERSFDEERQIVEHITRLIPQNFLQLSFDESARTRFIEFARALLSPQHPHPDHVRRLLELTKVDLLLRAVFTPSNRITLEMVDRSIAWGEHQLALRLAFWPPDADDKVASMTKLLLSRLHKGSASARDMRTAVHAYRDGSHEIFTRALTALKRSGALIVLGKNRQGQEIFALDEDDSEQGTNT
jgi:hypothetical protein